MNAFSTPKVETYDKNCKCVPQKKSNLKQLKGEKIHEEKHSLLGKTLNWTEKIFFYGNVGGESTTDTS